MKLIGEIRKQLQGLREEANKKIEIKSKKISIIYAIDHVSNILNNIEDDFLYFSKPEKGKT